MLKHAGIDPAPDRNSLSRTTFLRSQAAGIVACGFFCVELVLFRHYYVLFFIEADRRRVHLAAIAKHPGGAWTAQATRNFTMRAALTFRFVIRDGQFLGAFDDVFRGGGATIIRTPSYTPVAKALRGTLGRYRAPRAFRSDPHLEPSTTRTSARRVRRALQPRRPHRSLGRRAPNTCEVVASRPSRPIRRHRTCNGLITEYRQAA
jgi:hypothetical protein